MANNEPKTMTVKRLAAVVRAVQTQASALAVLTEAAEDEHTRAALEIEASQLSSGLLVILERFPQQASELEV